MHSDKKFLNIKSLKTVFIDFQDEKFVNKAFRTGKF